MNNSAFPRLVHKEFGTFLEDGLSKREYFAIAALQSFILPLYPTDEDAEQYAAASIKYANALIKFLEAEEGR